MPSIEIDLNEVFNGGEIEEAAQVRLPNPNVGIIGVVPDLILAPSTPIADISSSRYLQLDLNREPSLEDDVYVQANLPAVQHESSFDIGINGESGSLQTQSHAKKLKVLNNDERRAIYEMLLQKSTDGKLTKEPTRMVASHFSVSMSTVQRIWRQSKNTEEVDVSHKKTKNCGRKRVEINMAQMRDIPLSKCTTLESLACSLKVSKSTIYRRLKSGDIRRHSNAIKPFLKEDNKKSRLQFCISMLEETSIPHDPIFKAMHNIIHIDEKWFYMTKKSDKYYLVPDEEDPMRTCKSKNFIGKVMFLVALALPRLDAQGRELFSGKIGVFPVVTQKPARRTSVNRVAGTLETKPITSVNREVVRSYLIEKVLPTIKEKWPRDDLRYPIFIQQDNARTHIDLNDDEFCQAAAQGGFNIRLMCQPANSLDLNVLDLGFFSAIQSLQYKESPKTVDELITAVMTSFEAFSTVKSNHIFLTLQLCMIEVMKARGSYKYKIPHIKKNGVRKRRQDSYSDEM